MQPLALSILAILLSASGGFAQTDDGKPRFIQHPQSLMVPVGDTLRLSCLATGTPPISYIWQKDGQFVGSQTSATLLITNAQMTDAGRYAAIAANEEGLERSQAAQVIVYTNQPCNFPWAWMRKFRSTVQDCNARVAALALDGQGNIFVTGTATMLGTHDNYLTLKLDSRGQVLWTAVYSNPSEDGATPWDLFLDEQGNVYVTGSCYRPGSERDYLTIKYSPSGEELWTARFNSSTSTEPNASGDDAYGVVVGEAGCVYVSGNRGTVKYDAEGNQLWVNGTYPAGGGWSTQWSASDGTLVVCDLQSVTKVSSFGTNLWQVPLEKTESVALDSDGNIFVVGEHDFNWQTSRGDLQTSKINKDGQVLWSANYNGLVPFFDLEAGQHPARFYRAREAAP